jgi:N-acetyl sugar amidotransferase
MEYCKRCVYPKNAQPDILLDQEGVCSGCRSFERRKKIDWEERNEMLEDLLEEYKELADENNAPYDCIIPVSGGKDSHYQVYLMTEVYDMNPLLVTYNHSYNTKIGLRNLRNLIDKSGCELIRYNTSKETARKLSKYQLYKTGDITWHYHAGIMTFPIQTAVSYGIPLMIWGESGYRYKTGKYNAEDMVEFTEKERQEHDMRGLEPKDILDDPESETYGITKSDLAPFRYPSDEEIEEVGLRGIYLDNFFKWNAIPQTKQMIDEWDFATLPREEHQSNRTFLCFSEIDDAANGTHDYLKYLKYGYGRATDHAAREIRHGRMTREEAIDLVEKYDHNRPPGLDYFLEFLDMTEEEFEAAIEPMRDTDIWEQRDDGEWEIKDSITNHRDDPGVDDVRVSVESEHHWTDIANSVDEYRDEEFITL